MYNYNKCGLYNLSLLIIAILNSFPRFARVFICHMIQYLSVAMFQ